MPLAKEKMSFSWATDGKIVRLSLLDADGKSTAEAEVFVAPRTETSPGVHCITAVKDFSSCSISCAFLLS